MKSKLAIVLLSAVFGTACALGYAAPVVPAFAPMFTNTKAPLDIDYDQTELGSKTGKASVTSVLFFAWGDASATAAARDGGITTIRHADYEYVNVLGIYQSFTTVVRGD
jgi:hypothetical protein